MVDSYDVYLPDREKFEGRSRQWMTDQHFLPVIGNYRRTRHVDADSPLQDRDRILTEEVPSMVTKLPGTVCVLKEEGISTCWFCEGDRDWREDPDFYREEGDVFRDAEPPFPLQGTEGTWAVKERKIIDAVLYYLLRPEPSRPDTPMRIFSFDGTDMQTPTKTGFSPVALRSLREKTSREEKRNVRLDGFAEAFQAKEAAAVPAEGEIRGRESCGTRISVRAYLRQEQERLRRKEAKGQ